MRLRLSKKTRKKLPIGDDQTPLKTKQNLEEHLQSAVSFLQTQQNVLLRTVEILEEIGQLAATMKADIIRSISQDDEKKSRNKFKDLRQELKWLCSLEFNQKRLFSSDGKDDSFKLFKDAGPNAPKVSQPAAPHFLKPLQENAHTACFFACFSKKRPLRENAHTATKGAFVLRFFSRAFFEQFSDTIQSCWSTMQSC